MRIRTRSLARLALGLVLVAGGCGAPRPHAPHVIVIVVDTLRADRLGVYGGTRGLTPFLDELAGRGVRFGSAFATSSWTNPSIASLFTSRYPSQHKVNNFDSKLSPEEVTLAERLSRAGYLSAGFSANVQLAAEHGYGHGFALWKTFPETFKLRGDALRRAFFTWLDGAWRPSSGRPLFVYLQYMEPHAPYEPPPPFLDRFAPKAAQPGEAKRVNDLLLGLYWQRLSDADVAMLAALYDGEVAAADAELRELWSGLGARGVLDDAIVVVTADHGEEFREHEVMAHGMTLYDPAVRVPLLVVAPGFTPGAVVRQNVSLVDLAPTLLDVLGLAPEPRFEGRPLRALLAPLETGRDVVAELLPWQDQDWRQHAAMLVRGPLKLLVPPYHLREGKIPTTYDLSRDPGEQHPNTPALAEAAPVLKQALLDELAELETRGITVAERAGITEEDRRRLRALGYVQ